MKKVLSAITFALVFVLINSFNVSAQASSQGNEGVSTVPPTLDEETLITPFGPSKPDKNNVVDISKKPLTFAGNAQGSTLYTNSHFTGKAGATYNIKNNSQYTLTVKVHKNGLIDTTVQTITVNPGSTKIGVITGINSTDLYFLSFKAPSDFSGSVY